MAKKLTEELFPDVKARQENKEDALEGNATDNGNAKDNSKWKSLID